MTGSAQGKKDKRRITEPMISDMKQLFQSGLTISAIATQMGVHRQTVSAYLAEKHQDLIGDAVRTALLGEGLRNHFGELATFVRQNIRKQFNASAPEALHTAGKISTTGVLALPYLGSVPYYITGEWTRMYNPSLRERHMLKSLQRHLGDSKLWVYWDRWHKKVASFEGTSRALWDWIGRKIEDEPPDDIKNLEIVWSWVFGNILRMAGGQEPEGIETLTQWAETGGEFHPVVDGNLSDLSRYAAKIMEEARGWPELDTLKSAVSELASNQSQAELRRLTGEIDFVLAGIELMNAFPGKCDICPV